MFRIDIDTALFFCILILNISGPLLNVTTSAEIEFVFSVVIPVFCFRVVSVILTGSCIQVMTILRWTVVAIIHFTVMKILSKPIHQINVKKATISTTKQRKSNRHM